MLRISLGLLRFFEPTLLQMDIVGLSLFMKNLRTQQLQTRQERAELLRVIMGVSQVTERSFQKLDEEYTRAATRRLALDYTPQA